MFTTIDKALVPAVIALVLIGLAHFGITEDMTVGEALTFVITSCLVWLVPNKHM